MPSVTFTNQCRFTAVRWNDKKLAHAFTVRVEDGKEEAYTQAQLKNALPPEDWQTLENFYTGDDATAYTQAGVWVTINSPFNYCDARR